MEILLSPVSIVEKVILSRMLRDYQKELFGNLAPVEYKYLDSYWGSHDRFPFFILFKGKRIGFVLVNKYTLVEKNAFSVSEFYVSKEYRRKGLGKIAATKIFEKFTGKWEIREMKQNIASQNFWRNVIGDYTNGNYTETILDNELWKGPVQIFDNSNI